MNVTSFAAAAVAAGLSAFTVGICVVGAQPAAPAPVVASLRPAGIGWSFEWDDDDDDWSQPAYWECPAGCSILWEDDY